MPSLESWVKENIVPAIKLVEKYYGVLDQSILTQENVLQQVENLKTHPAVVRGIAAGTLDIHAWVYEIEKGDILSFNPESEQFELVYHQDI